LRGEPIVCTPDDGLSLFHNTEMDYFIVAILSSSARRSREKMLNGGFYRRPMRMKLIFKEDPKAWRKSTLLTAAGLAILSSLLRWRRHLAVNYWCACRVLGVVRFARCCNHAGSGVGIGSRCGWDFIRANSSVAAFCGVFLSSL